MKRFISRVQNLSQKAAELRQAVEGVPPKIGELRQTVAATAAQLRQLRATVQSSVTDLRTDDGERLIEALREIHDHAAVFEQAGYELSGVDMEVSPAHQVIVHLNKFQDVPAATIRSLAAANQNQKTMHALLTSLLEAEAVAGSVALTSLDYRSLIVNVGPVPSIRLCWRGDTEAENEPGGVVAGVPSVAAAASPSIFTQSSFFERRSTPDSATTAVAVPQPVEASIPVPQSPEPEAAPKAESTSVPSMDWRRDALDKYKKMPRFSKYTESRHH